jgi:hypothetical protein
VSTKASTPEPVQAPAPVEKRKRSLPHPPERLTSALGNLLMKLLLPLAVGFAAYLAAGLYHGRSDSSPATSADVANLQGLIQLTIAVVVTIGTYTVLSELTMRGLSRKIEGLRETLDALDGKVADLRDTKNFYSPEEGLVEARRLQREAKDSIETMWTLVEYDHSLKQYFADTLAVPDLYTVRIVAAQTVTREDLLDHVKTSWEYLTKDSYELHMIRECGYELTIVDHGQAAGLFFYAKRGYKSFFISSDTGGPFATAMEGLFAKLLENPEVKQVPIGKGERMDDEKIENLSRWLRENFYDSMG